MLLPSDIELIGENDLIHVVYEVVEMMDITELIDLYGGEGTTANNLNILLKVLPYTYSINNYTS